MSTGATTDTTVGERQPLVVEFDDNRLLPMLFGGYDENLARIERALGVTISSRGNTVAISGPPDAAQTARAALVSLYDRLARGGQIDRGEVDAAVRLAAGPQPSNGDGATEIGSDLAIRLPRRVVAPRSLGQRRYLELLHEKELIFALGPAGTGKTYLAVAMAVSMLTAGRVDRIILSRPAVEAGERLGFLPGDMREKVDPYLRPLFDSLYDMLPAEQVARRLGTGEIEVAPLAFMRGRTLSHAFVILDEAQNTTQIQMKMMLTRLGENARMVVTGDLSQVDLPPGAVSGLSHAVSTLGHIPDIAVARFDERDIVRHQLVADIVRAYDEDERKAAEKRGQGS